VRFEASPARSSGFFVELQLEVYVPRWRLARDHEDIHPAADIEGDGRGHPDSEDEPTDSSHNQSDDPSRDQPQYYAMKQTDWMEHGGLRRPGPEEHGETRAAQHGGGNMNFVTGSAWEIAALARGGLPSAASQNCQIAGNRGPHFAGNRDPSWA
jgi:hypothetical protein